MCDYFVCLTSSADVVITTTINVSVSLPIRLMVVISKTRKAPDVVITNTNVTESATASFQLTVVI